MPICSGRFGHELVRTPCRRCFEALLEQGRAKSGPSPRGKHAEHSQTGPRRITPEADQAHQVAGPFVAHDEVAVWIERRRLCDFRLEHLSIACPGLRAGDEATKSVVELEQSVGIHGRCRNDRMPARNPSAGKRHHGPPKINREQVFDECLLEPEVDEGLPVWWVAITADRVERPGDRLIDSFDQQRMSSSIRTVKRNEHASVGPAARFDSSDGPIAFDRNPTAEGRGVWWAVGSRHCDPCLGAFQGESDVHARNLGKPPRCRGRILSRIGSGSRPSGTRTRRAPCRV